MGKVLATIRLTPTDPNVDLNEIKNNIQKELGEELHDIKEDPIAFGLVALNVMVVVDDAKGGTDKVEEKLSKIKNVSTVEVTDLRRLVE
ncbi:translation elongation factor aEF-1 beta [Methanothermus fervidus DSM 2088]|uniref:Elongation factor 1-beta n=1 Tax=Methanothermus fervidus (strain ATCC 43054 / DSM 2088 / JCM 10308 / V24 S) TaxID=523846 RepID=E3GYJ7_METFV|nr:elongation factor 1-beta [Methanothermus fervidus]ADP77379.1 translation elongation factor aEF-1 beta [Methanothermus fervidus DSM 2088]